MNWLARLAAVAAGVTVGYQFLELMQGSGFLLRPPGAKSEDEFLSKCIRCGKCALACPYKVVLAADASKGTSVGTPYLDARTGPCQLCHDFPCVAACPTGALSGIEKPQDVMMGVAVLDRQLCIALKGIRCEVCYRVCPLGDEAIKIHYRVREGDAIHAIFEPVIDADKCVGCGICVERCVVSKPELAIKVGPNPSYKMASFVGSVEPEVEGYDNTNWSRIE
jgi:ferredoxin-type protein NapG